MHVYAALPLLLSHANALLATLCVKLSEDSATTLSRALRLVQLSLLMLGLDGEAGVRDELRDLAAAARAGASAGGACGVEAALARLWPVCVSAEDALAAVPGVSPLAFVLLVAATRLAPRQCVSDPAPRWSW